MTDSNTSKSQLLIKEAFEKWRSQEQMGLKSILIVNGLGYLDAISVGEESSKITQDDIKNAQAENPLPTLELRTGQLEYKLLSPRQYRKNEKATHTILELKIRDTFLAYARIERAPGNRVEFKEQRFLALAAQDFWQSLINTETIKRELQNEYQKSISSFKRKCTIIEKDEQELFTLLTQSTSQVLEADRSHLFFLKNLNDYVPNENSQDGTNIKYRDFIKNNLKKIRGKINKLSDNQKYLKKIELYEKDLEKAENEDFLILSHANWSRTNNWPPLQENEEDFDKYDYPIFKYLFKKEGIGKGTIEFLDNIKINPNPLSDDDLIDVIYGIEEKSQEAKFANFNLAREEGLKSQMVIALVDEDAEEIHNEKKVIGVLKVFSSWSEPLFSFKQSEVVSMIKAGTKQLVKIRLNDEQKKCENYINKADGIIKKIDEKYKNDDFRNSKENLDKGKKKILKAKITCFTRLKRIRVRLGNDFSSNLDYDQIEKDLGFEFNSLHNFSLSKIKINNTHFFGNTEWQFDKRMNILVGKNGFGKSYLFRLILVMLTQNKKIIKDYLKLEKNKEEPGIELDFGRSGRSKELKTEKLRISRNTNDFTFLKEGSEEYEDDFFAFGHVPILAIPDIRFVRRSKSVPGIGMPLNGELRLIGAKAYLEGEPYHDMIGEFISELCIRFIKEHPNKTTENQSEIFNDAENEPFFFLQDVVKKLTNDDDFKFVSIEPIAEQSGFEFLVFMNDAHGSPKGEDVAIPIQHLSQGTISVLAIFGIIHRFLKSLHRCKAKEANSMPGIVFIDEIDAHLHPEWQLKIIPLLTETFENVQFFISSHSPSIILNKPSESSLARIKDSRFNDGYVIDLFEWDDIFSTYLDVTRDVFGIQDFGDRVYSRDHWLYQLDKLEEEYEKIKDDPNMLEESSELLELLIDVRKLKNNRNGIKDLEWKIMEQNAEITRLKKMINSSRDG